MFPAVPTRNRTSGHANQTANCPLPEGSGKVTTAAKRVSTGDAIRRLAEKKTAPTYKAPRGNQKTDQRAVDYEVRRLESVLA